MHNPSLRLEADAHPETICLFCGEPETVAIHEIWNHEFLLETCCAGLQEVIEQEFNDDPAWARQFLRSLDIERLAGHRLRRLADDGACGLVLDWQLEIAPVAFHDARRFIARHHRHCAAPVGWRFGASVWNGRTMIGVVTIGNPVARAFCGRGIVEVNRLCVRRDLPAALRWNAASMLYGWSAREAARRGWHKIITYTREDEPGTSLRAAGWIPEARMRGGGWHRTTRPRSNRNGWVGKIRWSRTLTSDPDAALTKDVQSRAINAVTPAQKFELV